MPCPVCRNEFQIPKNGVADLPVRTHTKEAPPSAYEACSTDQRRTPTTVFCVDCSQKLCRNCGIAHKKMRGGKSDSGSILKKIVHGAAFGALSPQPPFRKLRLWL